MFCFVKIILFVDCIGMVMFIIIEIRVIDVIKIIYYVFYYCNIIVFYNEYCYLFMVIVVFWKLIDINDYY